MRKILLSILLSGIWFLSTAQTTLTLPSGYTPFATQLYYKIAGGDTTIISGATNKGFHVLQTTQALRDSLANYYTKVAADARFASLSGSYVNPSWITSLPQSKITGLQDTLSNTFIRNQVASNQTGGFRVSGNGMIGGNIYIGGSVSNSFTGSSWFEYAAPDTRLLNLVNTGKIVFRDNANVADLLTVTDGGQLALPEFYPSNGIMKFSNNNGTVAYAIAETDYVTPSGSITGNAGTATSLQTPRTIAGVSFNGTSNISLSNSTITNDAGYITSTSLSPYAPLLSPVFTGTVTIPSPFTLGSTPVLPTGTELNYVDGVTSNIQTQIDLKLGASLASSTYVPYTGASSTVNLGSQTLTTTGFIGVGTSSSIYSENILVNGSTPKIGLASTDGYRWNARIIPTSGEMAFRYEEGLLDALVLARSGAVKLSALTGSVTDMVTISTDGTLGRTAIPSGGGGGTVVSVGVASSNGFAGTSSGGDNPALTLSTTITGILEGNGTAISAASITGTGSVVKSSSPTLTSPNLGTPTTLVGTNISGTATGLTSGNSTLWNGVAYDGPYLKIAGGTLTGQLINTSQYVGKNAGTSGFIIQPNGSTDGIRISNYANNIDFLTIASGGAASFNSTGNFAGNLTALNLSGTNTGDQTTITGNAGTATALQTARNIQGVSFNGTADINPINGTGFVKATGTTLSYDNTTYAPLNSPALTGTPTAPTQTAGDNSTKVATTAYVDAATTRQLGEFYTNVQNLGSSITDLYTFTVPANILVNDGDKIAFHFAGTYASNANVKLLSIEMGSGFSPVISTLSGNDWHISGYLIKVSATTYAISMSKNDGSTSGVINGVGTVLNFTSSNIFKLRGDGDATGDITAKSGYLEFKPAAL